jgi:hypothetical protein
MGNLLKKLEKHWFYISLAGTIISSIITGGWYLKGKIDALTDTVNDTNQWVQDHDDMLQAHDKDITILKEDERLRQAGLLK